MHIYPPDFVSACKEEFPLANELHEWLDTGDDRVGRFLENHRNISFSDARIALHRRWCSIVNVEDRPEVKTQRIERKKA
jgi:hypothetical protein